MLYLILNNASRPGAVANMTLGEFKYATKQARGYMVAVLKHKTHEGGPADLSLMFPLYKDCSAYIDYVRNKLPGVGLETVRIVCQRAWSPLR